MNPRERPGGSEPERGYGVTVPARLDPVESRRAE